MTATTQSERELLAVLAQAHANLDEYGYPSASSARETEARNGTDDDDAPVKKAS